MWGKSKDADDTTLQAEPAVRPRPRRRRRLGRKFFVMLLSLLGPLAAIALGLYVYLAGGQYVSTDNAYIKSEKIAVSTDVSGRVVEVAVHDHQVLKPGALMFRIDPEPHRIALEKAEAGLASARRTIDAMRALYRQKIAGAELAKGDVAFYLQQYQRLQKLNAKGIVSQTNLDTANKNLRTARDQVQISMMDIAQVRARLGGDPDLPTKAQPRVRDARAARDQAALDLKRTEIRAPVAGIVTNFDLQKGEYVTAGRVVFSLVGTGTVWISANFRETDLAHVRVGQRATVQVDTYPDGKFEAVVQSISPATGAEFAVLPPQNTTGNWVKVVQRLTVRLTFETPQSEPTTRAAPRRDTAPRLRAGMSVFVEIDTKNERSLSGLTDKLLSWFKAAP